MRVLFIDSVHPHLEESLTEKGFYCIRGYDMSIEACIELLSTADGVVIRSRVKFDKSLIDLSPRLKFIARFGAGMENIDLSYAEQKHIACLHAPEGNKDAVGEHALGMLLCLFNNICRSNEQVRKGEWVREANRGVELGGKTVGVIGYGNMGSAFAAKLKGFDVEVLVYDKYKQGFGSEFIKEASLDDVLTKADVISMHVPLTPETHYMVNEAFVSSVTKPFYFINTSRGKVVKTSAIVEGLKSGKILGACLDVLEYEAVSFEDIPKENIPEDLRYLFESNKVILTSHIAGWTHESNEKMARILSEKIEKLVADKHQR
jgi:D-3-phosphoglycerate dehydrogenase